MPKITHKKDPHVGNIITISYESGIEICLYSLRTGEITIIGTQVKKTLVAMRTRVKNSRSAIRGAIYEVLRDMRTEEVRRMTGK